MALKIHICVAKTKTSMVKIICVRQHKYLTPRNNKKKKKKKEKKKKEKKELS